MKHVLFVSFALVSVLMSVAVVVKGADAKPADAKTDDKAVQGMWTPIKAELGGQPMDDAVMKSISMKLDDGKYEVLVGDKPDKGTYTLDSSTKPASMTVTGTEGPNKGKTFPAIYELGKDDAGGDMLRICYDLSGQKRPTEFKTTAGTKLYLVTYGRKKD